MRSVAEIELACAIHREQAGAFFAQLGELFGLRVEAKKAVARGAINLAAGMDGEEGVSPDVLVGGVAWEKLVGGDDFLFRGIENEQRSLGQAPDVLVRADEQAGDGASAGHRYSLERFRVRC